jgi:hypothetical protein
MCTTGARLGLGYPSNLWNQRVDQSGAKGGMSSFAPPAHQTQTADEIM